MFTPELGKANGRKLPKKRWSKTPLESLADFSNPLRS